MALVSFSPRSEAPQERREMATNRITELRERKITLLAGLDALNESAGGVPFTAEQQAHFDNDLREVKAISADLARHEELLAEQERAVNANPPAAPGNAGSRQAGGPRFKDLFGPATKSAIKRTEFFDAIANGQHHPLLVPSAAMVGGTGSAGGFLVPDELVAEALDAALEDEIVRPRARVFGMSSDTKRIAGFAAGNSSTGPYGFSGGWTVEGATIGTQNPLVRTVALRAKKLAMLVQASNELVADGLDFDKQISGVLRKAISWLLDYAFLRGTGSGEPLGILASPATITVSKEAGQAATTINYENVIKMFSRMLPGSINNSVWVANPTTIPQLLTIQNKVRNAAATDFVGGASIPVQTSTGGFSLLTRPLLFSEKLPALGTAGDLVFADFSFYGIGLRKDIELATSVHVGFQQDISTYRAILRADGQPLLDVPYTPKAGSTQSAFVILETR